MRTRHRAMFLFLALSLIGCTKNYQVHPGAANAFDSKSYDALYVADQTIIEVKADLQAGTLPATSIPLANQVIKAYDVARAAYLSYHDAAINGSDVTTLQATLQTDLDNLAQAIASYKQTPTPKPLAPK
jgi:hypothetical protein